VTGSGTWWIRESSILPSTLHIHTCDASDVGLGEVVEPMLPKDDDDQRSSVAGGGKRPVIQPDRSGESTALPNGGPMTASVVTAVRPRSVDRGLADKERAWDNPRCAAAARLCLRLRLLWNVFTLNLSQVNFPPLAIYLSERERRECVCVCDKSPSRCVGPAATNGSLCLMQPLTSAARMKFPSTSYDYQQQTEQLQHHGVGLRDTL